MFRETHERSFGTRRPGKIVIYGRSIGTGPSIDLASRSAVDDCATQTHARVFSLSERSDSIYSEREYMCVLCGFGKTQTRALVVPLAASSRKRAVVRTFFRAALLRRRLLAGRRARRAVAVADRLGHSLRARRVPRRDHESPRHARTRASSKRSLVSIVLSNARVSLSLSRRNKLTRLSLSLSLEKRIPPLR